MLDDTAPVRRTTAELKHPGERRNISKSAVRALDVMEYFAVARRPLRATDIAHAFGLHPSSTDQLLKTMIDSAYLLLDPLEKLYYPSPRLVRFANWLTSGYYGGDNLCRLIETVAAETREIVTLAAPHGAWLQIVDFVEPPAFTGGIRKGSRVPILDSALGAAFLAAHDDDDVLRWIRHTPEVRRRDADKLKEFLDTVRSTRNAGFSFGRSAMGDVESIAVALPKSSADAQLVLGIAGPAKRIEPRREAACPCGALGYCDPLESLSWRKPANISVYMELVP